MSVDRSGEKRSHAHFQTISGAGSAGCRMTMTKACGMPPRMGRNQGFTAKVRRLFWWPSDLSLAIGRICQICDRATRRTEVAHYRGRGSKGLARLPRGAIRAAFLMTAQPAKIEQGRGASMLEAIFDVSRNGVFRRAAGPCCKRAVVMLRDPRLPAVIVGGEPQPDRVCLVVVGHVHPSLGAARVRYSSAMV